VTDDAFGTAALRHAVAEAWLGSGTRFREDANTEEDHARGYYRDRVVVELAQNAADAATRAGVPGRLLLRLEPLEPLDRCERTHGPVSDAEVGQKPAHSGWRLVAANTGAPLDADGVASLASLRASAKTSGAGPAGSGQVGRFGVGFAAVRSVSDEVAVRSRSGGVRFSLAATRALLDDVTAAGADRLRTAVEQRGDALPVLRLPFSAPALSEADEELSEYDTVVELVLRDDAAVDSVHAQLDAVDDGLLLALPALSEVRVERCGRSSGPVSEPEVGQKSTHSDVGERWVTERRSGTFDAGDLADLPLEQRRADWSLVWALPRPGSSSALPDGGAPAPRPVRVLHAPTPTDVPLTFPALLVASFPVDPGRRQVQPGPATARLAAEAGRAYADLLAHVAAAPHHGTDVLGLVPTALPASDLDAAIRDAATDALHTTPLLAPPREPPPATVSDPTGNGGHADSDTRLVAPSDAVVITGPAGDDEHLVAALAPVVPGLVAVAPRHHAVARTLGATTVSLADVVDELPDGLPPHRWHAIYAALEPHAADPGVLEALAGARVPLADGRTVTGVRGTVVLPEDDDPALAAIARTLGVRVVHPDAAHPLLVRAGAARTDPRSLLDDAGVRAVALAAADALLTADAEGPLDPGPVAGSIVGHVDAGAQEVVDTVLALVRLALPVSEGRWAGADHLSDMPFWLGELPVRTDDGELAALRETTLPGTWAAEALDALAPVAADAVARYDAAVLAAAGAHADLAVYTVPDVVTPDSAVDLPGLGGPDDDEHGPDDPAGWLEGWSDYLGFLADRLGRGVPVGDVEAVADLDAVADDAWPAALRRLAGDPRARRALLATPRSTGATAPSYTAWWLRDRLGAPFALHDGVPLLPPAPAAVAGLDDETRRVLGGVTTLEDLDADDWPDVLERLPAVGEPMALREAMAVWRGLARLARMIDDERRASALDPLPDRLPALDAGTAVVHPADELDVAGGARWAQLGPVLPAPGAAAAAALADLLDLPVAGEDGVPAPDAEGERRELDPRITTLDENLPDHWWAHERLTVAGTAVEWWLTDDGEPHATSRPALAQALAEHLGRPTLTPLLAQALAGPEAAAALWTAAAWESETP
jgi:hypothetical protein